MNITITHEEYKQLYTVFTWMKYQLDTLSTKQLKGIAELAEHDPDIKDAALSELKKRQHELTAAIADIENDIPA